MTSWGPTGWDLYGRRFAETFATQWPRDVALWCYTEAHAAIPLRAKQFDLLQIDECRDFLERHYHHDSARGLVPAPCWRKAHVAKGYSFRTDAYKFCRKAFALRDAVRRLGVGLIAWIDADVITHSPVPADWLEQVVGDADGAYLGREGTHSECGFVALRLPQASPIAHELAEGYATDAVFGLPEWHDSYVFDRVREDHPEIKMRDLTPGLRGHVWPLSPLARCTEHLKGDRKREAA